MASEEELKQLALPSAKAAIKNAKYLILATANAKGEPWAAMLHYACDEHYNFYFKSYNWTRHAEDISANPAVALTLPIEKEDDPGIQIQGLASVVGQSDVPNAIKIYNEWQYPDFIERQKHYKPPEFFYKTSEKRFYKIEVTNAYVKFSDSVSLKRIEVRLR